MPGSIYSVGYEGLAVPGLIERLVAARVALVVDVRLNAISRKPGWSKGSLQAQLEAAGIGYRHEVSLGNPKDNRRSFRDGDGSEGRRRLRGQLSSGSRAALEHLVADAQGRRVAILCVERSAAQCHRQVIAEMAKELDPTIQVRQVL